MVTSTATSSPSSPPLRADAQRNRERILAAARELIAEQGGAVEMTDIADAAGVGVGTLYRRFPDKHELVVELLREKFRGLAGLMQAELERDDRSARERLDSYIRASAEAQGCDRGLHEAVAEGGTESAEIARATPGLLDSLQRLVDDAIAEGSVRDDLVGEDVVMCTCALGHAIQTETLRPGSWQRLLEIQLAGLDPRRER